MSTGGNHCEADTGEIEGRIAQLPREPNRAYPWVVLAVGAAVLGGASFVAYRAGFFHVSGGQNQTAAFGALLTLTGTLVTETIVVLGLLLKHSLDVRNFQLATYEQARLAREAAQASREHAIEEERLHVDTVIRAVGLLSTTAGTIAHPSQQAGAIAALLELQHIDLAISLLDQRWSEHDPEDRLSTASAIRIIDDVLDKRRGATAHQHEAVTEILLKNAEKLATAPGYVGWPAIALRNWPSDEPEMLRRNLILTPLGLCHAIAKAEDKSPTLLEAFFVGVARRALVEDDAQTVQVRAMYLIDSLLPFLRRPVTSNGMELDPAQLAEDVKVFKETHEVPISWKKEYEEVRAWAEAEAKRSAAVSPVVWGQRR